MIVFQNFQKYGKIKFLKIMTDFETVRRRFQQTENIQ